MSFVHTKWQYAIIAIPLLLPLTKLVAQDAPGTKYSQAGKVLATIDKHGHFYQVATDDKIYLLMCTKVRALQIGMPECKVGDKPIAVGDSINFRLDGDFVYMNPVSGDTEQKLRILTTELKVMPAPPSAAAPAQATAAKDNKSTPAESAVVIGTGMHVKGQHGLGWSMTPGPVHAATPSIPAPAITTASASTPVIANGPLLATPVTGGAPVLVMPTAPTTGGVVTGIPVTGGAPITAVPAAPVVGMPVAGAPAGGMMIGGGGGAPVWVHVLRIRTAGRIYQLECSKKPCSIGTTEIGLGDTLTVHTDKKHAYVSASGDAQTSSPEQEYKVLEVTDANSPADSKPE